MPLWTGQRIESAIDTAVRSHDAAALDIEGAMRDLVLETTAAYWSLVAAREDASVLAEAIAAFDAHVKVARDRAAVGMAAPNEVLAVEVEHDRAELQRLEASHAVARAVADLARLLGLPPGTRVEPTAPLATTTPEPEPAPEDLEALVARAFETRPERRALAERIAAAEARVELQRAARRPQAAAVGGYDFANPNRRILPPEARFRGTWDLGLSLTWHVLDGGVATAAVAEARALVDAARQQLEDLTRRIRLEVTERVLDLHTAVAAAAVAGRARESARENRRVSEDRFREGVIASADLLDAETALLRAGLDLTLARVRIQLARAGLVRAAGD